MTRRDWITLASLALILALGLLAARPIERSGMYTDEYGTCWLYSGADKTRVACP